MLRFMYETNPLRHKLARTRDYITDPKDDGYRSVHHLRQGEFAT
jgi:ppGpp synthetase/RelA/SpoT-type nucleotidyltranferase